MVHAASGGQDLTMMEISIIKMGYRHLICKPTNSRKCQRLDGVGGREQFKQSSVVRRRLFGLAKTGMG